MVGLDLIEPSLIWKWVSSVLLWHNARHVNTFTQFDTNFVTTFTDLLETTYERFLSKYPSRLLMVSIYFRIPRRVFEYEVTGQPGVRLRLAVIPLRSSRLKTWPVRPSLLPFLSLSGCWQIVGGANGKAPAPVPLVHRANVKGTIRVTAVCCHDRAALS